MKTFLAVGIAKYNDHWPRHKEQYIQAETMREARVIGWPSLDMDYNWTIIETEIPAGKKELIT